MAGDSIVEMENTINECHSPPVELTVKHFEVLMYRMVDRIRTVVLFLQISLHHCLKVNSQIKVFRINTLIKHKKGQACSFVQQ